MGNQVTLGLGNAATVHAKIPQLPEQTPLSSPGTFESSSPEGTILAGLSKGADKVSISSLSPGAKAMSVTADEILRKLREKLGKDLPSDEVLKSEDYTPEATAERIFQGVVGLLGVYARQNPELKGKELVESFLSVVRPAVKEGYESARSILGEVGALDLEGVSDGIAKTMELLAEKFDSFAESFDVGKKTSAGSPSGQSVLTESQAPNKSPVTVTA